MSKVWNQMGEALVLGGEPSILQKLENVIYKVQVNERYGWYLVKEKETFAFDYKLYGLETALVNRALKSFNAIGRGNMGVLLNGLKGTGKTVCAKQISNGLNQPVILVDKPGCSDFLNSIPQDITIFMDEYEKTFQDSSEMLQIMDGASNSDYRRVFLMTTNKLYIDDNLIQRPGRVRYLKKFEDLAPEVVEEIVDDLLQYKEFKAECLQFISTLENITVDIVKAVLQEVNIHNEGPSVFADVFNVVKLKGKYHISLKVNGKYQRIGSNVTVYPAPRFQERQINDYFQLDGHYIGLISKIINNNTLVIEPDQRLAKSKNAPEWLRGKMTVKVETADTYHSSYKYNTDTDDDDYSEFGVGFAYRKKEEASMEIDFNELRRQYEEDRVREEEEEEEDDASENQIRRAMHIQPAPSLLGGVGVGIAPEPVKAEQLFDEGDSSEESGG